MHRSVLFDKFIKRDFFELVHVIVNKTMSFDAAEIAEFVPMANQDNIVRLNIKMRDSQSV